MVTQYRGRNRHRKTLGELERTKTEETEEKKTERKKYAWLVSHRHNTPQLGCLFLPCQEKPDGSTSSKSPSHCIAL